MCFKSRTSTIEFGFARLPRLQTSSFFVCILIRNSLTKRFLCHVHAHRWCFFERRVTRSRRHPAAEQRDIVLLLLLLVVIILVEKKKKKKKQKFDVTRRLWGNA